MMAYSRLFPVHVSVVTVMERIRGYFLAISRSSLTLGGAMGKAAEIYIASLRSTQVLPLNLEVAPVASQLMALFPSAPTPPRRSHRDTESRQDRLSRWRFDIMVAATALVHDMPLIHNNPQDFEPMRALIETVPERFPGVGPLNLISVKRLAA